MIVLYILSIGRRQIFLLDLLNRAVVGLYHWLCMLRLWRILLMCLVLG